MKCIYSNDIWDCEKDYCVIEDEVKKAKDPISLMFNGIAHTQIKAAPNFCKYAKVSESVKPVFHNKVKEG